ncbi:LysR family transcriptional regulator [Clostridium algidicarnis]|uniref:LysR family transcriptional regulator n=1 Tax=Clostridium algidicarnis TaxID=37659 RepID=UPI001C0C0ED3|nr:LysR family transcriptional regulator [Clostridium algidicarnis]MBU3227777.1 LysR family transcriptional regulator [Clostridium algidicarnis]MBU3251529.1 LysR family transcriptional regulator [Clostridium algidicarnis]
MFINLELYRIFYMTAKLGSMSKAAKELFTSQPSISQSIKQLEEKLGGQLLYRNAKGVSLTVEGEVLFQYIEQGYSLIQTAERKFLELKQLNAGQLRIAVCSAVCKYDLLKYINLYSHDYPNIKINIKDESSYEIAKLLDLGEIDIGILNLHNADESNFNLIRTFEMQDCFVVGENYKTLCEESISIQKLTENYPIIMLQKGGNTREYIDKYFHSYGIDITPQIQLSSMDLMVEFAIKGLGIACVIKDYVQKELQSKLLYELTIHENIPARNLGMVIRKGMPISTAAQKFIEIFCA